MSELRRGADPSATSRGEEPPGWEPIPLDFLGDRIWTVMGGGGLKGLAHVGAWQAIEEARVPVAGIVGTSIGALSGACVAGGMGWKDLVPRAFALRKEHILSWRTRTDMVANWSEPPLLFARPRLAGYGTFDFDNTKFFLEEGYRATRAALLGKGPTKHHDA